MRYVSYTTVRAVEERSCDVVLSGVGKDAVLGPRSTGWWIVTNDLLAFCVGVARPSTKPGDAARVVLETGPENLEAQAVAPPRPVETPAAEKVVS